MTKQVQKEEKDYHFIYFIESHEKNKYAKIYLSADYPDSNTLEQVLELESMSNNVPFTIRAYRFKTFLSRLENEKDPENREVTIRHEDENKKIFEFKFYIKDIYKDLYIYDLIFQNCEGKNQEIIVPPKQLYLSHLEQFDIYTTLLRKFRIFQGSEENEHFILAAQNLLIGPNTKYDFSFYLSIFLECFANKYVYRLLLLFKPEKVMNLSKIEDLKLHRIKTIFSVLEKNPDKILKYVPSEKDKEKIRKAFYIFLFNFYFYYDNEKAKEILIKSEEFNENILKELHPLNK